MGVKNKHKHLVGVKLRKTDFAQWDEKRFMKWFEMVHFFAPKGKYDVTDVSIRAFQERCKEEQVWEEWMHRYEIAGDDFVPKRFVNQLSGITGTLGAYLQENPHAITNDMRSVMKANPYLTKYTEPYTIKELDNGMEVVTTNQEGGKYTLPEIQYHKAMLKMSALANDLVSGITKDDIKKMAPAERIKLSNMLVTTMSRLQGGHRPNIQIFKQLVVNEAKREDLESALIEMSRAN